MIAYSITSGLATAALLSLVLVPFLLKLAVAYGLYDFPDNDAGVTAANDLVTEPRKIHSKPIPRIGGIAIVMSFFITGLIWSYDSQLKIPLIASGIIFALGLLDDIYSLSARIRLTVQILCAGGAVYWGNLVLPEIALTPTFAFELPFPVGLALSVFIIVGAINSINMIDGLDGLAGGVVLIGVSLLSFLHFVRTQDIDLIVGIAFPMIGSILGFLRYNTFPASIFMGDSGSNWLGFMLGILILVVLGNQTFVHTTAAQAQHMPLISAVLCLSIAVFDTLCVMISRMVNGLSPMAPDKRHFHHTLLKLGFGQAQSVSAVYFLSLAAGILGILPAIFSQYGFSWLPYVVAFLLILVIPLSVNAKKEAIDRLVNHRIFLRTKRPFGRHINTWIRYWESINRYVLYFILMVTPLLAGSIKSQVGYAAAFAVLLILIVSVSHQHRNDFFESLSISVGAIILLVANNMNVIVVEFAGHKFAFQPIYNAFFLFLFFSTLLLLAVTFKKRYFDFTPSDFLLLTVPLVMLVAPESYRSEYRLDIICLRSLVVFMCVRTMVKRRHKAFYQVRLVTLAALVIVMLTGIWGMRVSY